MEPRTVQIYFSDFFGVSPKVLDDYGAFDVSLINDLPLFIDPFLLFNSDKPEYRQLHDEIIRYLRFLRDRATAAAGSPGLLANWYQFKEVKQTWLGFSKHGNQGSGLGLTFAKALNQNLSTIFRSFGQEQITRGSHLEKVCLVSEGVGRDNISDFTTNLIKEYLLKYTQQFARDYLLPEQRGTYGVERVRFNYETESWQTETYELPRAGKDYVLLTPRDMLTRDDTWISRTDLLRNFEQVVSAVPDAQLRAQLDRYLKEQLSNDPKMTAEERINERKRAAARAIQEFPQVIEHYIRDREDRGDQAKNISAEKVEDAKFWLVESVRDIVARHLAGTEFYSMPWNTLEETRNRIMFLKHCIEHQGVYRIFYHDGKPVGNEAMLQLVFKLVWRASTSAFDAEVNNGRGPVDFSVSRGSGDKTLVEFKLASNSKLKQNLSKQLKIYFTSSAATGGFNVICYFTAKELSRVQGILKELNAERNPMIILIDARDDNKPSGSKA